MGGAQPEGRSAERYGTMTTKSGWWLAVLVAAGGATAAQEQDYKIDPAHSAVEFGIRHMAISTVHGRFGIADGVVHLDDKDASKSSVVATMNVASVDTGNPQRDEHLKSPDFFDTTKFPTAAFKSTSVTRTGDGFDVAGELTLHGVTKPVTLHMEPPSKEQIGVDKKPHRGFAATTTIHRQDFGLTWNGTLASGDKMLGDDVKMTFEIEAGRE